MGTRNNRGSDGKIDLIDVVEAVADAEGTDSTELKPPLGEVVDAASLETFLTRSEPPVSAAFRYRRWKIEISSDGGITLSELPAQC